MSKKKVYIYKNFIDSYIDPYSYMNEDIKIYLNKSDALAALKEDVEDYFGIAWDNLEYELSCDCTVTEEYVLAKIDREAQIHWGVEEKEIIG